MSNTVFFPLDVSISLQIPLNFSLNLKCSEKSGVFLHFRGSCANRKGKRVTKNGLWRISRKLSTVLQNTGLFELTFLIFSY